MSANIDKKQEENAGDGKCGVEKNRQGVGVTRRGGKCPDPAVEAYSAPQTS